MSKEKVGFDGFWADLDINNLFIQEVRTVIFGELPYRQRQIIVLYYGLDCESLSLKQIAEKLEISSAYVGQLKNKALRSCRRLLRQAVAINSTWGKMVWSQFDEHKDRIKHLLSKAGYPRVEDPFKPLAELNLSNRTAKRLKLYGVTCLFDLVMCNEQELRQIYGFGPKCIAEVKGCLKKHKLYFLQFSK